MEIREYKNSSLGSEFRLYIEDKLFSSCTTLAEAVKLIERIHHNSILQYNIYISFTPLYMKITFIKKG